MTAPTKRFERRELNQFGGLMLETSEGQRRRVRAMCVQHAQSAVEEVAFLEALGLKAYSTPKRRASR